MKTSSILITQPTEDYELLDSGEGEKLERFASTVLSRPDPQALWKKNLGADEWKKADAHFSRTEAEGAWKFKKEKLEKWPISFSGLKFWIKPTAFKHVGIFPEQSENWNWMRGLLEGKKDIDVLNLFGYTGGASLACAQGGAKVVHIDGSKSAIAWARENAELSGLSDKPIRWILEDARVFVGREVKRGNKYDAIIMDPPAFGHGANKELWKIEEDFLPLVEDCMKLLKDTPLFFIINGYSAGYSALAYENVLGELVKKYGGSIETGELTLEEKGSKRLLPCGIFARWNL
ncbi:MAG: class I SAM-dependent methyltransferase [Patescibacteria group bacterium]